MRQTWHTAALALVASFGFLVPTGAKAASDSPSVESYASYVGGKIIQPGQLLIDNQRLYCGHRPTVLDSNLDDYGAAFPGFVILNPKLLARVSTPVKLWIYSHECGHQYRGPDESKADCFAVQRGRRYGWLTSAGVEQICEFIRPASASMMHLSGSQRCEVMRQCFQDDKVH